MKYFAVTLQNGKTPIVMVPDNAKSDNETIWLMAVEQYPRNSRPLAVKVTRVRPKVGATL